MGKRAKPEKIIAKLREVDARLSRSETTGHAIRAIGITEQTYHRWRKEYDYMSVDQAKRLKELEKENRRLRRAVSELTIGNQILAEAAKGSF
ncbi:MAG: transposase [Pseudomonadota bacterium]